MELDSRIQRCRDEQERILKWLRDNPNTSKSQKEGCMRGIEDWIMEEALLDGYRTD